MHTMIGFALLLALTAPAAASADGGAGYTILAQATEPQQTPTDEAAPEAPETAAEEDVPEAEAEAEAPAAEGEPAPAPDPVQPSPETAPRSEPAAEDGIMRSEAALPEPVRETWRALVEAARSGDVERLRPIVEAQPEPPTVAFDEVGDPVAHLRSLSGDAEGREILAILLEVLETGFLHVDEGTPEEMYLWPYFARHPIDELTPPQMVELFTLLTAGDYQDMLSYGAYIFFRVGIAPDGRWMFFVAGD